MRGLLSRIYLTRGAKLATSSVDLGGLLIFLLLMITLVLFAHAAMKHVRRLAGASTFLAEVRQLYGHPVDVLQVVPRRAEVVHLVV